MALTNTVTIVGNVTDEPTLRFTPSGSSVVNLTVASTERYRDNSTNEWKDGETVFMRCVAWKSAGAENIAESIGKGNRVIVSGKLKQRSFTTDDGNKRQVIELEIDEIGPSLKFTTATPAKTARTASGRPEQGADSWATAGA